jgi:sugar phosphate isomerase/epimerase
MRKRLGVAGSPEPRDPKAITREYARSLAGKGISTLVTHLSTPPDELVATGAAARVRATLEEAGIKILQATGYNPLLVTPDAGLLEVELTRLRHAFAAARALGSEMIISGCGSLNPEMFYAPARANHEEATRERLVAALRRAARDAEDTGITLAMECHVMTALDTPDHIRETITAVDSPLVRVNFDPVNLLGDLPSLYHNGARMREMWQVLGPLYAPSAHLKDVRALPDLVVHIAEVPPGAGELDLAAFYEVCRNLGAGAGVIVEHLELKDVDDALRFAIASAAEHDISFERETV